MAARLKTVEFVFPTSETALVAATRRDFSAITLYLPETTSRTFRSVRLEVSAREQVAAGSLSSWLLGIKLGAVAFDDVTVTDTITNSGEEQHWFFTRDVTSYFTTNFGSGATQTCQVGVQFGTQAVINITAKLVITYEWSDTSQTTRVKTVKIPLDGHAGDTSTTLTELGTNQVPDLDDFLPEGAKVYRNIWFECWYRELATATTDLQISLALDSESADTDGAHEQQSNSGVFGFYIWDRTGLTTSAAHAFKVAHVGQPLSVFSVVLCVTYEYDQIPITTLAEDLDASETAVDITSASGYPTPGIAYVIQVDNEQMQVTGVSGNTLTVTRGFNGTIAATHANGATVLPTVLNSVEMPFDINNAITGRTASGDQQVLDHEFWVEEPGFVLLRQSGVLLLMTGGASATAFNVAVGGQTHRAFDAGAPSVVAGGVCASHRFDSGGAQGSGHTLTRGKNTLTLKVYQAGAEDTILQFLAAHAFVNYTSGRHADGDAVHNHTVQHALANTAADTAQRDLSETAFTIPETNFWVNGFSFHRGGYMAVGNVQIAQAGHVHAEVQSGEGQGAGWRGWFPNIRAEAAENNFCVQGCDVRRVMRWQRFGGDPDTDLMAIETSRLWRLNERGASWWGSWLLMTYHAITFAKTSAITGSGGGTVNATLHYHGSASGMLGPGEKVASANRSGNGNITWTWFDDTEDMFAAAHEDGTHVGRSNTFKFA